MKLPIDTSAMTLLCAQPPQPVMDFVTKGPESDENGPSLFRCSWSRWPMAGPGFCR